jgi:hypothetical protein
MPKTFKQQVQQHSSFLYLLIIIHYHKSYSCGEPSVLLCAFGRANGKIVFCRGPNFNSRQIERLKAKKSLPNGVFGKQVFCREPFVADSNMLLCRTAHGKETFFRESFSS